MSPFFQENLLSAHVALCFVSLSHSLSIHFFPLCVELRCILIASLHGAQQSRWSCMINHVYTMSFLKLIIRDCIWDLFRFQDLIAPSLPMFMALFRDGEATHGAKRALKICKRWFSVLLSHLCDFDGAHNINLVRAYVSTERTCTHAHSRRYTRS